MASNMIEVEYKGKIAIVTINNEKKLGALNPDGYYALAKALTEVAKRDDIYITVLVGKGRFFSAGADVTFTRSIVDGEDTYRRWLTAFVTNNINITRAFYRHPKILVAALNGPAVGLSAALLGFADFIYAAPHTFILTPFSSLGLVAEGGASYGFVQRMGIAKANEALIMSKRLYCEELVQCGFINKVIDTGKDRDRFLEEVLKECNERMGDHLNNDSLVQIKALIRKTDIDIMEKRGVEEAFQGLQRFASGQPQEEFAAIASGKKKHKL